MTVGRVVKVVNPLVYMGLTTTTTLTTYVSITTYIIIRGSALLEWLNSYSIIHTRRDLKITMHKAENSHPRNKSLTTAKGHVSFEITTHLTKHDKSIIETLSNDELDNFVDRKIARRLATHRPNSNWKTCLPKWLRPQCGSKTRAGGKCRATPVWDKENDKPRNGRCRMHGGLSTGAKTAEGKRRALKNLKQYR